MTRHLPRLGLGILCWQGHDSLARVLPTYVRGNLFSAVDAALLFLPEPEDRTIALGRAVGLDVATHPQNLGILGGFKAIAERLQTDHLLLLEDDCPLIEGAAETARQISIARRALASGGADVFRLRHRQYPGAGVRFHMLDKLARYHARPTDAAGARLAARVRRLLRPGKALRLLGNALYEGADPHRDPYAVVPPTDDDTSLARAPFDGDRAVAQHPKHFELMPEGWIRAPARVMPWSNQSIMVGRDFYLGTIIAHAEAHPSRRKVNGFSDVEKEWNTPRWRRSGFRIGLDRGLFAHELA